MDFDVVILGAGPAGLACALTLRRHAPHLAVAVVAPAAPRWPKLGETLPPGSQSLLRALGVWERFVAGGFRAAFGTASAWGNERLEGNEFIFHPDQRGWHLDRADFDALLAAEAEARAVRLFRVDRPLCWTRAGDHWQGRAPSEQGERRIGARFVVDATGGSAAFATAAGARRLAEDRLVAVSRSHEHAAASPLTDPRVVIEACEIGWWYSAPTAAGGLTVALFTDADLARTLGVREPGRWVSALRLAPHTRDRVGTAAGLGVSEVRSAASTRLDRVAGDAWLAAGDAASTFDPLSSQGVVKALRQGIVAAYAAGDRLAGDESAPGKYAALVQREHAEFAAAKQDFYRRETRWARASFWRRRHRHVWLSPECRLDRAAVKRPHLRGGTQAEQAELLRSAGKLPASAADLVRRCGRAWPAADDRAVVIALQDLVEAGVLATVD